MRDAPRVAWQSERIASLVISSEKLPFLDAGFADALGAAVDEIARRAPSAVVLEGSAPYFSAGASRESLLAADAGALVKRYVHEVPKWLLALPAPTIAAMEGHAIGGGLLLGLWCDVAYFARESLYGANFMSLGFTPGMGSTRLVERYFGRPLAREALFSGALLKGREIEAASVPASRYVTARDQVREQAYALAESFAEMPQEPLALLRSTFARRDRALLDAATEEESAMHARLFGSEATRREIEARYPPGAATAGAEGGEP